MKKSHVVKLLVFICILACRETTIRVSPNGDDSASGTSSRPVATIQAAILKSRETGIKQIIIREGKYYDVSVNLSRADSGLTISGENDKVFLYGGKALNNWQKEGDMLVAEIPGVRNRSLDFRLFMTNDTVRSRARLPERGAFTHLSKWDHEWQSSQGGWSQKPTEENLTTLLYQPEDLNPGLDVNNAELTVFHMWDDSYVGLKAIDTLAHKLIFSYPATHPAGAFAGWGVEKARQYIVWNTREGMTQAGQWYLDRSAEKLYYRPFAWENSENLNAVIPTVNQVFKFEKGAKKIAIENLRIACAGAPVSNTGYGTNEIQGAIQAFEVSGISFSRVSVKNVSGWAIKVSGSGISLSDCEFSNTYAGGVSFEGNTVKIERCGIHDVGILYNGAVGIMGGGCNNLVSHCEMYNLTYAGVNGLGSKSVAEFNLVYNFKTMLEDGGAFYCYGGDSTIYRNNAVLARNNNRREGWTYYFDELSKNCTMENNLAVNTITPVHNHMADGLIIRNNLFIDQDKQVLANPLCSNVHFTGNIFVANSVQFEHSSGEPLRQKKESYNAIFQKFYEANGVVEMIDNQFLADDVKWVVLEMYQASGSRKLNPDKNIYQTGRPERHNYRRKIPEAWETAGYRNNFAEVFEHMILED